MRDPRKSGRRPAGTEPSAEEKRFNIILRSVFVLLIFLMIVMTIIWQLATPGSNFLY